MSSLSPRDRDSFLLCVFLLCCPGPRLHGIARITLEWIMTIISIIVIIMTIVIVISVIIMDESFRVLSIATSGMGHAGTGAAP